VVVQVRAFVSLHFQFQTSSAAVAAAKKNDKRCFHSQLLKPRVEKIKYENNLINHWCIT
jgi:hypothetical protein